MSFIRQSGELAPVEVELSLNPGLPQILFLGLPDAALKESSLRIRSALRAQGYQLPQAHQVLVHLKPTHLKKSSRGLDLAVAAALIWETEQIQKPELPEGELPVLYGELSLKGEVVCPDDLDEIALNEKQVLWTGKNSRGLPFSTLQVRDLMALREPERVEANPFDNFWERPLVSAASFPQPAAELAAVVAAGEHPVLLAGPPGSGKSTMADSIAAWIEAPQESELKTAKRLARQVGRELKWRPVLKPHHSITPLAMIGGGQSLFAGEITRAHGGVLIMDELLEFHSEIQEAMREPVESGSISIVRAGSSRTFPAQILLIATTNLCGCGKFVPRRNSQACRCPKNIRRKILNRLSGPFSDRFSIFALTDEWKERGLKLVPSSEIGERVERAIRFRREARQQQLPNSRASSSGFEEGLSPFCRSRLDDALWDESRRRRQAVIRVARTLADLRLDHEISMADLETSLRYCLRTYRLLEEWQD